MEFDVGSDGGNAAKVMRPPPEDQGECWTCEHCSNLNWPLRTVCNKCKVPAPWAEPVASPSGGNAQPPPENQGECWTCQKCQNLNWPLRTVCKMCKAPGPWTCPACGNKNFQLRDFCNKKQCGLPRPSTGMGMPMMTGGGMKGGMPMGGMMPYMGGGKGGMSCMGGMIKGGMPMMMGMGMAGGMQGSLGRHPPGSWTCKACQNVNWPLRTTCNNLRNTCDLSCITAYVLRMVVGMRHTTFYVIRISDPQAVPATYLVRAARHVLRSIDYCVLVTQYILLSPYYILRVTHCRLHIAECPLHLT